MNALTSYWRPLCAAAIALAFGLTGPSQAQDKKDARKSKDDKVIIIQLDASKLPPDVLKKLLTLSKSTATADAKKGTAKKDDDDDDKKPTKGKAKKDDDDDDKKPTKGKGKAKKDDDDDKKRGKKKDD